MTAPTTPSAAVADPRIAFNAGPLLAVFNRAGVVSAADVHVAQRLGRLAGESDERVHLAVALAVRALRSGAVCVPLGAVAALSPSETEEPAAVQGLPWPQDAAWRAALTASPLVATGVHAGPDRPVRWVGGRLYLDRYWRDEQLVRTEADARLQAGALELPAGPNTLGEQTRRLFPAEADTRQRLAAATTALSRLTVITGGPGTGKTTTVARLLAVLQAVAGPGLRTALAAPTGRAAARLQQTVRAEVDRLDPLDRHRVGRPEATTVHRLLGSRPGSSTRFRHDRHHRLPHDVVVVDETSMVALPLMARLLEALRPQARLVLVGDPDQLASVDAGAVLGDLVARPPVAADGPGSLSAALAAALPSVLAAALPSVLAAALPADVPGRADRQALRNGVVRLDRTHRFGGAIADLATAIRAGDADGVLGVLRRGDPAVELVETSGDRLTSDEIAGLRADTQAAGTALVAAARAGDAAAALRTLEVHRLLLAHRQGPHGVATWAARVEDWIAAATAAGTGTGQAGLWYPGRPLLVTANDRGSGLSNGDAGVVINDDAGVVAAFGDPASPTLLRPHRLPDVETVHAMTVHRGQGSQFATVSVILPPSSSPLLTRELLYTAVTRARRRVRLIGSVDSIEAAVRRPVRRPSGLREPRG